MKNILKTLVRTGIFMTIMFATKEITVSSKSPLTAQFLSLREEAVFLLMVMYMEILTEN